MHRLIYITMLVTCTSVWGNRACWEGEIGLLLEGFTLNKYMSLYTTGKGR